MQEAKVAFLDIEEKLANKLEKKILKKYNSKPLFIKCDLKNINELKESIKIVRKNLVLYLY